MKNLQLRVNPKVKPIMNNYPELVRDKIFILRDIILETAQEIDEIKEMEETLKWGEPSYLT